MNRFHRRCVIAFVLRRWLLLFALVTSTCAFAEPLRVALNFTTSSRWLESARASVGRDTVTLEGNELTLGGSVDVVKRITFVRIGGQAGAEIMPSPEALSVQRAGPLNTLATADEGVSSLLILNAAPFVGLATKAGEPFEGWLDVLISVEVMTARVDLERHFAVTPVPTIRLGGAVKMGSAGLEVSFLASYFGAPRVSVAVGVHF